MRARSPQQEGEDEGEGDTVKSTAKEGRGENTIAQSRAHTLRTHTREGMHRRG